MNKSTVTSKGRQVIKPKKILTTSSDENINIRRKISKGKPIQINKALHNLALKAAKIEHPMFKQAKYKQVDNYNVKEKSPKPSCSTNETRSLSIGSVIDLNSNTMIHENTNRSVLREIVHANNHSNRINTIDCSKNNVTATNSLQNIDRRVFSSGHNNAVSQDQRPITDHNLQTSEKKSSRDASSSRSVTDSEEKNISFQNNVIQLLNKIVDQNTRMYNHIKSLQSLNKMEMAEEHLYNRPDGLPLATVEEFQTFESDTASLHNLQRYLGFIGGIKLREALHRFQKETMTDELTAQFTYWGRTADSIPFYNTKIAKTFFLAAKRYQTFEGPRNVAEFKNEIMEVLRTAKQRYTTKTHSAKKKPKRINILEDNVDEDNGSETETTIFEASYETHNFSSSDKSDDEN